MSRFSFPEFTQAQADTLLAAGELRVGEAFFNKDTGQVESFDGTKVGPFASESSLTGPKWLPADIQLYMPGYNSKNTRAARLVVARDTLIRKEDPGHFARALGRAVLAPVGQSPKDRHMMIHSGPYFFGMVFWPAGAREGQVQLKHDISLSAGEMIEICAAAPPEPNNPEGGQHAFPIDTSITLQASVASNTELPEPARALTVDAETAKNRFLFDAEEQLEAGEAEEVVELSDFPKGASSGRALEVNNQSAYATIPYASSTVPIPRVGVATAALAPGSVPENGFDLGDALLPTGPKDWHAYLVCSFAAQGAGAPGDEGTIFKQGEFSISAVKGGEGGPETPAPMFLKVVNGSTTSQGAANFGISVLGKNWFVPELLELHYSASAGELTITLNGDTSETFSVGAIPDGGFTLGAPSGQKSGISVLYFFHAFDGVVAEGKKDQVRSELGCRFQSVTDKGPFYDQNTIFPSAPSGPAPGPSVSPPENVQATPGPGEIEITWDAVTDASEYEIFVVTGENSIDPIGIVSPPATSFVHSGLSESDSFTYMVGAEPVGSGSATLSIEVGPISPNAPA